LVIKGLQTLASARYSFRESNPDRIVLVVADYGLGYFSIEAVGDLLDGRDIAAFRFLQEGCGDPVELLRIASGLIYGALEGSAKWFVLVPRASGATGHILLLNALFGIDNVADTPREGFACQVAALALWPAAIERLVAAVGTALGMYFQSSWAAPIRGHVMTAPLGFLIAAALSVRATTGRPCSSQIKPAAS
jgi:hypothetical protein